MSKSQQSFNKKELETKRRKKKEAKVERQQERKKEKAENGAKTFEEMLAYVDENGHLTSTPPDPSKKKIFKAEDIILGASPRDNTPEDPIRKGAVKFFNHDKGYGFINDADNGNSVFVHINDTSEPIQEGDKVSFEIQMGPKGPNAVRVKRIS